MSRESTSQPQPPRKLTLAERAKAAVEAGFATQSPSDNRSPAQRALDRQRHTMRWIRRVVYGTVIVLLVYMASRFSVYRLPADYQSMEPGVAADSTVVLDHWCALFPDSIAEFERGQIVLFEFALPTGERRQRFARIIAKPGQMVSVKWNDQTKRWHYTVEGRLVDHPGPLDATDPTQPPKAPGRVPESTLFVLEDSMAAVGSKTLDSRDFGFLPFEYVKGRLALQWANADAETMRPIAPK